MEKLKKEFKKHIRVLAEKYNHRVEYIKDVMVLKNEINEIKLWKTDKYGINVTYNLKEGELKVLKIETQNVYDLILDLLCRTEQKILTIKTGDLITLKYWINEEGEFVENQLEKLKADLKLEQITSRELGGNRYEAEFYNGVLILMDDLCWAKSNVISI